MKLSNKAVRIGDGEKCPKCFELMERRKHPEHWKNTKSYYFTKWDYCQKCKHVQHYDEFKSSAWQETEHRDNFFKSI